VILVILIPVDAQRKCSPVGKLENGSVKGSRKIGRSIRFSCLSDYSLQGVNRITCLNTTGKPRWSTNKRPFCARASELCHNNYLITVFNVLII